jgi:hypothetical protein
MPAKKKAPDAPTVRAVVLYANESFTLKVGQVFEAEKSVIDSFAANGDVDPHPDAVEYALSVGAEVVTQPTEAGEA